MPPRASCARIRSSSMACAAVSSAEVGSSSSQSGRCDRDQPRDREPAFLPGREIGRRQIGQRFRARPRPAHRAGLPIAAEPRDPEREIFRDRQRGFQGVAVAEIMRLFADGCARHRRLQATTCRPRSAASLRSFAAATTCRRRCARSPAALRRTRPKNRDPEKPRGRPAGRSGLAPKGSEYQPLTSVPPRTALRDASCVWMPLVHMADRRKRFYKSQLRPLLAKTAALDPCAMPARWKKQRPFNALGSFASAGTKRKPIHDLARSRSNAAAP